MFSLPELRYQFNALEPWFDAQTMEIHYSKHHQTYVDKLNAAVKDYPDLQAKNVEDLLSDLDQIPAAIRTAVRNFGGGVANHNLFWELLAAGEQQPGGQILAALTSDFGSWEKFKELFTAAAASHFGSGWAWLTVNSAQKLEIISLPNQDSPLSVGKKPLLALDVWEHAYYLKYQNRRPEFIEAFWHVVNWTEVEKRFTLAVH
jgi:Fe-Mn family superoxide dismutase